MTTITTDVAESDVWRHNNLQVNSKGEVEGDALTHQKDGYDVSVSVYSYNYERRGEQKQNHVPIITVTDGSGSIVAEPDAHDSENAETAIENALGMGEWAFNHMNELVE